MRDAVRELEARAKAAAEALESAATASNTPDLRLTWASAATAASALAGKRIPPVPGEATPGRFSAPTREAALGVAISHAWALVYGLGFPPFHGGAFRWLDTLGSARYLDMAQQYQHLGPLYEVPEGLRNKARHNEPYYPPVAPARPAGVLKSA